MKDDATEKTYYKLKVMELETELQEQRDENEAIIKKMIQ